MFLREVFFFGVYLPSFARTWPSSPGIESSFYGQSRCFPQIDPRYIILIGAAAGKKPMKFDKKGIRNRPEGGSISALAIDPITASTLYIGTSNGGLFKSTDGGKSWSVIGEGQNCKKNVNFPLDEITDVFLKNQLLLLFGINVRINADASGHNGGHFIHQSRWVVEQLPDRTVGRWFWGGVYT